MNTTETVFGTTYYVTIENEKYYLINYPTELFHKRCASMTWKYTLPKEELKMIPIESNTDKNLAYTWQPTVNSLVFNKLENWYKEYQETCIQKSQK